MRVALLTNLLSPYRLPVLADLAATPGWRLRVFVDSESDPSWARAYQGVHAEASARLDVQRVPGLALRRRVPVRAGVRSEHWATLHLPLGVWPALARFRPDVVLSGELGPRSVLAAAFAALHGLPLVLWSYPTSERAASAGPLRRAAWRALLGRADSVVGMGSQARAALRGLGVAEERLFDAPNAHDARSLEARLAALEPTAERAALRARTGARERIALVAGRLEASKGILPLLAAWRALPGAVRDEWTLLFVGDGPLAGEVERARRRALPGEIARLPALPHDALAGLYAAADLLVFPSLGDPWGVVVNEAMACGLPVLCSRLAGCADDLVFPGENGWLCDPTDADDLRGALAHALTDPHAARLGERARDMAKRFAPERQAQGLRRAIKSAARR